MYDIHAYIHFQQVALGRAHGLMIVQEKDQPAVVKAWGSNERGQLGTGTVKPLSPLISAEIALLRSVLPSRRVVRVCCGADFSMAILASGACLCW
jgi:alpha-tubulin suppressor-like RCC1 family protein